MGYGVGIDLGTTTCTAAVCSDGTVTLVRLSDNADAMPAAVSVGDDGALLTGQSAERAGRSHPDRVTRNFRSRLGDPTPVLLGSAPYSAETLLATLLTEAVRQVTAEHGQRPDRVVVTCPASWGPYRREQFDDVPVLAGVGSVSIVSEAQVLAARFFAAERSTPDTVVAVYDLGGEALEVSVVRATESVPDVLGTPGGRERVGGLAFDELLFGLVDDRLGGAITRSAGHLDVLASDDLRAEVLAECSRAKRRLSSADRTSVTVSLPDGDRDVEVTRAEFDELIAPELRSTVQTLRDTIRSAGLESGDLTAVLLAGGTSEIPLLSSMLSSALDCDVRLIDEPAHAVALGAAEWAGRDLAGELGAEPIAPPVPQHAGRRRLGRRGAALPIGAGIVVVAVLALLITLLTGHSHSTAKTAAGPTSSAVRISGSGPVEPYYIVQVAYAGAPEFLYEIAQRFLNDGGRNLQIFQLNQGRLQPDGQSLTNPNKILPGWILVLPPDAAGAGVQVGPLPCCFSTGSTAATTPAKTTSPAKPATTAAKATAATTAAKVQTSPAPVVRPPFPFPTGRLGTGGFGSLPTRCPGGSFAVGGCG